MTLVFDVIFGFAVMVFLLLTIVILCEAYISVKIRRKGHKAKHLKRKGDRIEHAKFRIGKDIKYD